MRFALDTVSTYIHQYICADISQCQPSGTNTKLIFFETTSASSRLGPFTSDFISDLKSSRHIVAISLSSTKLTFTSNNKPWPFQEDSPVCPASNPTGACLTRRRKWSKWYIHDICISSEKLWLTLTSDSIWNGILPREIGNGWRCRFRPRRRVWSLHGFGEQARPPSNAFVSYHISDTAER